ncbi:unnamed protein product [Blepharisma stoltei]|uniref:Maturase K n=1 Tax=Blepharisma stoltei TaxID=1481888 RepID=A0AAU9J127_9CILI|nr:unnamed protein product [Blepharisma stoltei]
MESLRDFLNILWDGHIWVIAKNSFLQKLIKQKLNLFHQCQDTAMNIKALAFFSIIELLKQISLSEVFWRF